MIDLKARRMGKGFVVQISAQELPEIDLTTVEIGDWIEGFGTITSFSILGFLHQMGRSGFLIVKKDGE